MHIDSLRIINNNKNIIYINLPKKVYRKPHHNKEETKREFSNQSNLFPTLYRPIYNDISPNMNRPIPNDNFIKMGNAKEVIDVESNIDEINSDFERYKNTFEETNPIFGLDEVLKNTPEKVSNNTPKKVIIRRGRPSKYLSVEERKNLERI
jgi:hypothetical protein